MILQIQIVVSSTFHPFLLPLQNFKAMDNVENPDHLETCQRKFPHNLFKLTRKCLALWHRPEREMKEVN